MSTRQLTTGEPVPVDESHRELRSDGQQKGYVVLSPEERAKGFVKPVRRSYTHDKCGCLTTMGHALAETYARDPNFYSGTFCCECATHFPLDQFHWEDGEPMDTLKQPAWNALMDSKRRAAEIKAAGELERRERAELARLKAKYEGSPAIKAGQHD